MNAQLRLKVLQSLRSHSAECNWDPCVEPVQRLARQKMHRATGRMILAILVGVACFVIVLAVRNV